MRIPIIEATEPLPVISPEGAGRGWRAIGAAAGEAQNLGNLIAQQRAEVNEKERIAQDTLKAIELDGVMRAKFLALDESYLKRDDWDNFDKDLPSKIQSIKSEIQPQNASRELNISFERSFKNYAGNIATSVKTRKYKVMEEHGKIALGDEFDRAIEDYSSTDDSAKKEIIKKNFELTASKVADDNLIDPLWADRLIKSFYQKGQQIELINGVNSNDPSVIQATISKKFDKVDAVTEANLKIHGQNRIDVLNTRAQALIDKQKTTIAHKELSKSVTANGERDYNAMTRQLHNPNFQEQYGLSIEQVHQLDIDIRTEATSVKSAQQDKWDQTDIKNYELEAQGKLTPDIIRAQVANGDISPAMGRARLSGDTVKTNTKYYIDTLNKTLEGKNVTSDIYGGIENKMLDTAHAAHLTQLQFEMKKAGKEHYAGDQWFQLAKQDLANHFGTMEVSPEELFRMKLAGRPVPKKDYDGYSEALSTLMRTIEKNKLTGENIWNEGQKLIKFYSMKKAQGTTDVSPDKYGFMIGQRKDKGNQTYQYIGENKWRLVQ